MSACGEDERHLGEIARRVAPGGRVLRYWELAGGVSARAVAVEVERHSGERLPLVVRHYGAVDLSHNPNLPADEFRLLSLARRAGIPAPRAYVYDRSPAAPGGPFLVVEYIEGALDFSPEHASMIADQLATTLAEIHRLRPDRLDLAFLPRAESQIARKLAEPAPAGGRTMDERRIREALAGYRLARHNAAVLLHGDYWPGNALWRDGRLVAIVDWEDAAVGDPLADLANARLELLWALGADALRRFTAAYVAAAAVDLSDLPWWDLWAALRPWGRFADWAPDAAARVTMIERHRQFYLAALQALGAD